MDLAFLAQRHVEGELRCQEWTVNGDNGADGNLAQRHVDGELRFLGGEFRIMSKTVEELARETHSKIGNATHVLAQV